MMRALLLGAVVLALVASCSSGGQSAADPAANADWNVGCPETDADADTTAADFDEFTLACLSDGKKHELGALDGRPMVITLWATWCDPCRDEAPAFKEFHAKLGDKVNLIGVDTQDDSDAGVSFAHDAGWRFPSVVDKKGSVMKSQGITALPATFFVDEKGATVETFNESRLTTEKLLATAKKHFGVVP